MSSSRSALAALASVCALLSCSPHPMLDPSLELPATLLSLCNDARSSLRIRPNWAATVAVPPGQCVTVRVPVGPALLTVWPVARPYDWLRHPAGWVDVPSQGAQVRYFEEKGFIDLHSVAGTPRWARCAYPASLGRGPRPPRNITGWREDVLRWMRTNLVCDRQDVARLH